MDEQEDGHPQWGSAGQRPGAPRSEDQLREQGVSDVPRRRMSPQAIQSWVDQSIQQAERQGAFDDLPGAGKPLREVDTRTDPDWWIKGLIEREHLDLSGAMPGVMQLRREKAGFPQSLLELPDETAVRVHLMDFNQRVLDDRRRPHAGSQSPPVVGRVDVDQLVQVWRELRASASASERSVAEPHDQVSATGRSWRHWMRRFGR
ncbi:MAG: DUF1992 domain-containing protein [Ornithinimicrobium sp.]|uniref:DnaJ family domain-containing protein n=1 Tax=Ornithinimicrobium sp. TaxID=1977084 RepID=UPI0026E07C94|nr:DUF1992 domain-containing protein [Ornithinimicrobium sp.]MDO5740071.1 DUF1992 domain-containing protein [Ornithinimicrobium sp.]